MNSTVEAICKNLRKKIQEICEFLSHTDWVYKQARLFVLITTYVTRPLGINNSYVLQAVWKKLPQGASYSIYNILIRTSAV